jgi:hypothetical protein
LIVEPGDITGLSTALERLSEDRELRARLGQAARQRASDPADLGRLSPISLPRCADFDAELSHNAPQIRRTLLSLPGAARQIDPQGVGVTRQDGTLHCQPDK